MRSKPCGNSACPNTVHERHGHGAKEFEGRRFCCFACSVSARRITSAELAAKSRPCLRHGCDKPIIARPSEGPKSFAAKKFCSTECQRLALAEKMVSGWRPREAVERRRKPCLRCPNEVVQYPNEGIKKWERRQYCCKACSRSAKQDAARSVKGTRSKGNTQHRETRFSGEFRSARVEAAVNRLRRSCPVYPVSVVQRPDREPGDDHRMWMVGTRQMSTEELLVEAARL